jgi:hypothetical protein
LSELFTLAEAQKFHEIPEFKEGLCNLLPKIIFSLFSTEGIISHFLKEGSSFKISFSQESSFKSVVLSPNSISSSSKKSFIKN